MNLAVTFPQYGFLIAGLLLTALLIVRDHQDQILPNSLNAALALAGVGFHWTAEWSYLRPFDLVVGAAAGAGSLYLIRFIFIRLRGIEALGLGDVKLMAAAGCWIGPLGIAPLLTIASLATLLTIIGLRACGIVPRASLQSRRFAFGPGLCFGLVIMCSASLVSL